MATRRHHHHHHHQNGGTTTTEGDVVGGVLLPPSSASPPKDGVRRRLFETPQKSIRSRKQVSWFIQQWSRKGISSYVIGVGLLLIGVGAFLALQFWTNPTASRQDGLFNSYRFPLRRTRRVPLAKRILQPLQEKDWNQYTIRINTWQRPEQLMTSIDWHAKCPGVAQIQVIWCDPNNEPPAELLQRNSELYGNKVVIERHTENSLNERFRILIEPPTLGILSIDDDVLRPCVAIDAGFFKWTVAPDRMVGFDARVHVENDDGTWKYGYMSTTEKENRYTMSLTRYCFLHRDYLNIYMNELPLSMLDSIATNFNCEDIAMSFLISSLTDGKPSLLADTWAMKSMIKLYVEKKISGGSDHKHLRDVCIDTFADMLGMKDSASPRRLKSAKLYHHKGSFFDCGDSITEKVERSPTSERQVQLQQMLEEWRQGSNAHAQKEVQRLMSGAARDAFKHGLIENSDPWKERFHRE